MHIIEAIYIAGMGVATIALLHPTAHIKGDGPMTKPKDKPVHVGPTTEDKVKFILADLLQIDETDITPLSKIQEDLHADSLDVVEFIMILEEHFDIQIPDEKAEKVLTVADAIRLVDKLRIAPRPTPIEAVWG